LGALITTDVVDDTAPAVAVKVALLKPVPMVTPFGIVTVGLEDVKAIEVVDCATLPRLKVHALEPGVWMVDGEQTRLGAAEAGAMVSVDVRTIPPSDAVIVALPEALAATEALKFAEAAPAAIGMEPGTVTCALLLLSETLTPPCPAAPLNNTVHALVLPAFTVSGAQTTEDSDDCPVTASEKVTEVPARLAVRTDEPADTAVAVNVALVAPDGIITEPGTVAALLPLESATVAPPDGAVVDRNTVHVALEPGASDPGLQDMLDKVTAG